MMDSQLENNLIECLSLLEDGESIERILERFPEDAASLRPLLETANLLTTQQFEPSEAARLASRRAFLNQAHELREAAPARWRWFSPRFALMLASVVFVFLLMGGVVAAADSALPDQTLYPVKLVVEDTRLLLAPAGEKAALTERFMQRRRDEIATLLADGRSANVELSGIIEAIGPDAWRVAGLAVQIAPTTRVQGTPLVGARALVQGHTAAGRLFADLISIVPGSAPAPSATAIPSATTVPTPTARPSATARPSSTPAPSPTTIVEPTPAPPPPEPTRQPPTAAPERVLEFSGAVEVIGGGAWQIGGQTVLLDGSTEIRGTINPGDPVKVRAIQRADGTLVARRIERIEGGGGDGNANGNDSGGGGDGGGGDGNANSNDSGGGGGGGGDENANSNDSGGGGGGGGGDGNANSNDSGGGGGGGDDGGGGGGGGDSGGGGKGKG